MPQTYQPPDPSPPASVLSLQPFPMKRNNFPINRWHSIFYILPFKKRYIGENSIHTYNNVCIVSPIVISIIHQVFKDNIQKNKLSPPYWPLSSGVMEAGLHRPSGPWNSLPNCCNCGSSWLSAESFSGKALGQKDLPQLNRTLSGKVTLAFNSSFCATIKKCPPYLKEGQCGRVTLTLSPL